MTLDTRYEPNRLLICDRNHQPKGRLLHYTLDGEFIEEVVTGLGMPTSAAVQGYYVSVPDLHGRVVILNKQNVIMAVLGFNPDPAKGGAHGIPQDKWIEGIFTAPTARTGIRTGTCTCRTGTSASPDEAGAGQAVATSEPDASAFRLMALPHDSPMGSRPQYEARVTSRLTVFRQSPLQSGSGCEAAEYRLLSGGRSRATRPGSVRQLVLREPSLDRLARMGRCSPMRTLHVRSARRRGQVS